MAKSLESGKGIGLAILGIVAVIAIVGLVLLFSGAKSATGKAGDEQPYASLLGGKEVNTYLCPDTCGIRGMRGSLKCTVNAAQAGKPATKEFRSCPGKLEEESGLSKNCDCYPERHSWT